MQDNFQKKALQFGGMVGAVVIILLLTQLKVNGGVLLIVIVAMAVAAKIAYEKVKVGLPQSISHGSAAFATEEDIKEFLVDIDTPLATGAMLVGPSPKYTNGTELVKETVNGKEVTHKRPAKIFKKRIDLPQSLTVRHIAVIGPNGSGKGRGFFLWQLANYKGSFFYADPKSEGWLETSGHIEKALRFAPRDPDNSSAFNWVPICGRDPHLALLLCKAIVSSNYKGGGDAFYVEAESAYLASVFAHASTFENPTPAAAYDFMCSYPGEILLEKLLKSSNLVARQYARMFANSDPRLRGNILVGAGITLVWLADEKVRRFTSATKEAPDFGRLRKEKVGVYWCLAETDVAALKPLSALFFTLALHQLKEAEGDQPVALFLDEIANIGKIPNLEVEIAILRGRNISLTLGLQSIAQLEAVYGKAEALIILDNCLTKIILAGLDYKSAEYVSKALGEYTFAEKAMSTSHRGSLSAPTKTHSIAKNSRDLLSPDEVRRIGEREQIVIITNKRPILGDRFWYTFPSKAAQSKKLENVLTMDFWDEDLDGPKPDTASKPNLPPSPPKELIS